MNKNVKIFFYMNYILFSIILFSIQLIQFKIRVARIE